MFIFDVIPFDSKLCLQYSKCSKNGFHLSFTELIGNYSKHNNNTGYQVQWNI